MKQAPHISQQKFHVEALAKMAILHVLNVLMLDFYVNTDYAIKSRPEYQETHIFIPPFYN